MGKDGRGTKRRTSCWRVNEGMTLEAERLFGGDSDGDSAAIHCVGARSKSRLALFPFVPLCSYYLFSLFVYLCICLFVYLFICLFVYLFICLFVYLVLPWRTSRSRPSLYRFGS
jgi:hypothetical protein